MLVSMMAVVCHLSYEGAKSVSGMKRVEIIFIFILIIECIFNSETLSKALAKTCTLR